MATIKVGTEDVLKVYLGTDELSSLAIGGESITITPTYPEDPCGGDPCCEQGISDPDECDCLQQGGVWDGSVCHHDLENPDWGDDEE